MSQVRIVIWTMLGVVFAESKHPWISVHPTYGDNGGPGLTS